MLKTGLFLLTLTFLTSASSLAHAANDPSDSNLTSENQLAPSTAASVVDKAQSTPIQSNDPFDHRLSMGGYAVGWAGSYPAAGVGGRIRFEWPHVFGVEGFSDHVAVEWPGGFRHDHPIGFNLYKPFQISQRVRIRPLLGACVVFSFIEPTHSGGPSADDILFGVHGGVGMEFAIERNWSLFAEAQGIAYLGHDRTSQNWTASVSQGVSATYVVQPNIGVQAHFL